ncbi:MAG TPA: heavy metal translocating P-type ATPase [Candidatus Limnocylindrales bacterium]|nr:heavy metal translocating P-type ATPase [Candidatus Limnocylindrales bacterium]
MAGLLARLDALTQRALLPLTVGGLVAGLAASWAGNDTLAWWCWTLPSVLVGVRLAASIIRDLLHREAGVDIIAVLAIAGALLLGESLAASVIGVMLATGEALERYADGRAHRELAALLARAPRTVHRYEGDGIVDRPIDAVAVGDRLVVKPGEVIPVDGMVSGVPAVLDESALTGESRLATKEAGEPVSSGTVNAGAPFDLVAQATAADSTYAGIVRLVEEAQSSKAPFVRLADRYALLFVPLTLAIAGIAWVVSGDPVRALSVLVVATPCPLLLAAPIAIVAGISRSAKRGIIVKGGGALEAIARASVLLFDKTGTLTAGRPHLADVTAAPGRTPAEVLRLAASLEQLSPHVLAASIVAGAREREVPTVLPGDVEEIAGAGVRGTVDGRAVLVGTLDFAAAGAALPAWVRDVRRRVTIEGATGVYVAADGELVGALVLDDPIRPETPRVLRSLRRAGVRRIVMVTGDHYGVADMVGSAIGVDAVLAERTPADKVDAVAGERADAHGILVMVGDGLNDAPALATADVGVAMGARGATASSEAADLVITVDRLDRLPEAIRIAQRSRSIAVQSVVAGMGMSIVAMLVATTGLLPPVAGALIQEAIDVIVILNALRALSGGLEQQPVVPGWAEIGPRLADEHRALAPALAQIRALADGLGSMPGEEAKARLEALRSFLVDDLVPHEEREDREVFPLLAKAVGNDDVTAALHRTHSEIFHLVRFTDRLVREVPPEGPSPEDLTDLRRVLYGLDAILRLHMAQEEELYVALADDHRGVPEHPLARAA